MSFTSKDKTYRVPKRQDTNTNTNINLPQPEAPYIRSAPFLKGEAYIRKMLEPFTHDQDKGGN